MSDSIGEFLTRCGWGAAARADLAGDASARRYQRLTAGDGARAVLMIAPPESAAETRRFTALARHLSDAGLSAPRVLAADPDSGLVLLEDFGDALVARLAEADPHRETELYLAAVDTLAAFRQMPMPEGLAAPDADAMAGMIAPLAEWYLPEDMDDGAALIDALRTPLAGVLDANPRVFAHRDYHAENLIWLPGRAGAARIGLLDFQDAFAGPPVYDLLSLIEDARRGLGPGVRAACIARYADLTGRPVAGVEGDCAVIGAQRNLRILGIFARLALHAGKPRYLDLIPRVWDHLAGDLSNPALAALRDEVARRVPPPEPDHLNRLRDRCLTAPAR